MASSPVARLEQQTWVPFETAKDCSKGFCSIYCPQWCYIIFPPPPPFSFVGADNYNDSASTTTFSPLVITIIGILASALLLVSYYTIISKYCRFRRRRQASNPLGLDGRRRSTDDDTGNGLHHHDAWHVPPSTGLDEALISKISVYKYKRGEGLVDGTDHCSVCLGEFREEESLRLLPRCTHAFHMQCIDTWLRSHSNCPLCRANIVISDQAEAGVDEQPSFETVIVIQEDAASSSESAGEAPKDNSEIIEIQDNENHNDDDESRPVSIADTHSVARNHGKGSSRRRSRMLHSVISPVPMKRSVSSGRFGLGFDRQRKRRSSVIPL